MKEPEYYDADRWGIFSDNYEEKEKKNNAQFYLHIAKDMLDFYLTEVPFLWGNILPQRGLVCLAGESDCGKSAFLRQFAIAFCATSSERFLGMDLHNNYFYHKKALYISTEDEQLAFGPVMRKQCRELGIEHSRLDNLYVVFENDKIIEKIENFLKDTRVGLIVIDCLNDVLPTQATSAVAVRKFLSKLQHIAEENECLIIMTHHTCKHAHNRKPSKYNLIGSPAIEAKCRTVIELRTDPFQRNLKHLCIVKGNYIDDKEKEKSYMLEFTPQLTFKNTGRRVDIDTLTLMPDHIADRVQKYNRLRNEGLRGDELAKAMGFASRGSLSVWVKKYIKTKPEQQPEQQHKQTEQQPECPKQHPDQLQKNEQQQIDQQQIDQQQQIKPELQQQPELQQKTAQQYHCHFLMALRQYLIHLFSRKGAILSKILLFLHHQNSLDTSSINE